jgi:hypothetical protein
MKQCPFCKEMIQDEAVKCRFCGEFLPSQSAASARQQLPPSPAPGHKTDNKSTIVVVSTLIGSLLALVFSIAFFRTMTFLNLLVLAFGCCLLFVHPFKSWFATSKDPAVRKGVLVYKWITTFAALLLFLVSTAVWIMHSINASKAVAVLEGQLAASELLVQQRSFKDARDSLLQMKVDGDLNQRRVALLGFALDGLYGQYLEEAKGLVAKKDYNGAAPLLGEINSGWSRYGEVASLNKQIAEGRAERARAAEKAEFERSFGEMDRQTQEANNLAAQKRWLAADAMYEAAWVSVDLAEKKSRTWLGQYTPRSFNAGEKKKEIEALRQKIARPVATEEAQQDHQRRLAWIGQIKAKLDSDDRSSYLEAKTKIAEQIAECGRCKTAAALKSALREVESMLNQWPMALGSIQEMKTRYADLRGRKVQVKGVLSTSTYYNCRFGSQNKYRSFELSEGLFGGIHVYCSRGDAGCESIFQRLAAGSSQSGTAILEYPERNSVCEAGQAFLLEWR